MSGMLSKKEFEEKFEEKLSELYPEFTKKYARGADGRFGNYHFPLRVVTKSETLNFSSYDDFDRQGSKTMIEEISYKTYEKIYNNKDMILSNLDTLEEKIKNGKFEQHNSIDSTKFDNFREIINVISDVYEKIMIKGA